MHPEDIKAELRKRHGTLKAFEEARGLPRLSTTDVLLGRGRPAVEAAIAQELNMSIDLVFPSRRGRRRGRPASVKTDFKRARPARHRQNQPPVSTGAGR
jgi:lambda repressor-like predicted transcriptional regulator